MPRTTLDLDAGVLRDLRRLGDRDHKSMGRVASELLARSLAEAERGDDAGGQFTWVSRDLGRPRVDLQDADALRAVLGELT